jgi:PAS domain S-box-containing protein
LAPSDAIIGKAIDGSILSWNSGAERLFGWTAAEIVGRNIRLLIPEERMDEEDAIISCISRGDRVPTFETVRLRKDGSPISLAVTVSPVLDENGQVIAASKIARDITDRIHIRERLEQSEERFRLLADNISQLAWIAASDGGIFWYNKRWYDYTGKTLETMKGWGWQTVHHPDHVEQVTKRFQEHIETGQDWEDTFPLRRADGIWRWFLSRATPIRGEDGKIAYWFGTNTDVTEMRDAEQRIELLLQEVNHRSKNMLAIIMSLARRSDAGRPDFLERLEQRIRGLAANQDLLVSRSWSSVPVIDMVRAQLRTSAGYADQIDCEGPEIMLSPGAAEALAMAIHEMETNAVKYGALSVSLGRVAIRWSVRDEDERKKFVIEWRESGGPQAVPPERPGFGTRIIVDVPRMKLNADIDVQYLPSGFRWKLECALDDIS